MKNLILITFIFSYVSSFFGPKPTNVRPPGTVPIVDNFFFDETEISNISWKEYLDHLMRDHGKDSPIYKNALPDTTVWITEESDNTPFAMTYFQHPSYDYYPVVGISYEQANTYCIWRTKVVKEHMKQWGHEVGNFKYRLPTQTEWELVAAAGYSKKQKKLIEKQTKKYGGSWILCNMIHNNESSKGKITSDIRKFLPNKHFMHNLYGNVAEMVAEPNIAMGGSYCDRYEDIVPSNKVLPYDGPQRWLGFRCVAEYYD